MRAWRPIRLASAFAAGTAALLAAGCGGGNGGSPGVANVASSGTVATTTTRSSSGSVEKAPGGSAAVQGGFQISMNVGTADGPKFSTCMRKHGVANFPDPDGQGLITLHSGMGIDPQSPAFKSARTVCDTLLPNGGQPTPAQIAQRQRELLAFSACMRAHGLKDFPDPSSGGFRIEVHPGSDLDPNKPTFRNARLACQGLLPFKGGG